MTPTNYQTTSWYPGGLPVRLPKRSLILVALLCLSRFVMAQAPTSLKYPTPNVYIANVSNVYLAPTVAGNVTSYSISPALPTGMAFNTNTGVISGVPTAASTLTNYTIKAKGGVPLDSTATTIAITVTNNYFNNNFDSLFFGGGSSTIVNKVGDGSHTGDIVVYQRVATISGQQIDCVVKTTNVSSGTTYDAVDQAAVSGSNFNSNNPRFFSPQVQFPAAGGSMTYDFQFILGGTYVSASNIGTPVVLQNVRINIYDIDGNGNTNSNQYAMFSGFDSSSIGSPTTLQTPTYDTVTGLTRYRSNTDQNNATVTDPRTRVRLSYRNISDFSVILGGLDGLAYFFIDFSVGPAFASAVTTTAPTIDLNTSTTGVNNGNEGCGTNLAFSASGQTNVASQTALNELRVEFNNTAANIRDGANERIIVNGGTPAGNNTFALNFAAGTSTVTLGGVTYLVTRRVTGTTSELSFTNNAGATFTLADAETLVDALQYSNAAATPTNGSRDFSVFVRNTAFESPSAIFTASLNCVSISGNIYHDVNGLSNDSVNANGPQFTANQLYAVRVDPTNNQVIDTRGIAAGGAYSFGTVTAGTYALYFSTSAPAAGSTFTASVYPNGTSGAYKSIGENLGAGAGNDLLADGKLLVTVGSVSVTNANFGIELPPVTRDSNFANIANPGGFNAYTLANGSFKMSDEDGSVSSLTITSFPVGANYLKVGTTVYINGGNCPPQSVCTAWPGSVTVPVSGGNPTQSISVDPVNDNATAVTINFTARDNGGLVSNTSAIVLPFVTGSYFTLSGNVWNDANGNGLQAGGEELTAAAAGGETLYAMLVQTTKTYSGASTVLMSAVVNGTTGYNFTNVPAGNDYEVRIVSRAAAPTAGVALSTITPALASGWTAVSTNNSGTITTALNTNNPVNSFTNLSGNKTGINFGIERIPNADAKSFTAPNNAFTTSGTVTIGGKSTYSINGNSAALTGAALKSLSGNDAEDCSTASSCNTGKTYVIKSVNSNTRIFYDFGAGNGGVKEVTGALNSTIINFDPAKLTIYGQQGQGSSAGNALGFTYSLVDLAGIQSAPAAYALMSTTTPLPVVLESFNGNIANCTATLSWKVGTEVNMSYYSVEQSKDAAAFQGVTTVVARNQEGAAYTAKVNDLAAGTYFRLKMVDASGAVTYSKVLGLDAAGCASAALNIWPNPAHDVIKVNGLVGKGHVIVVSDYTGRQQSRVIVDEAMATINIGNLAPGAYLVQVFNNDGSVLSATRLIKQ